MSADDPLRAAPHRRNRGPVIRRRATRTLLVAVVAAAAVLIVGARVNAPADPTTGRVPPVVTEVVDGDTVTVHLGEHEETVRLIGIDTPETKHPTKPVECFGPEASNRTAELLAPGTEVTVERDAEERDAYGRLLAYVVRRHDGLFVNLQLAREGFADALSIRPNTAHAAEIGAAVRRARDEGQGLWGVCPGAVPSPP